MSLVTDFATAFFFLNMVTKAFQILILTFHHWELRSNLGNRDKGAKMTFE